jgi:hypothetical protein
MLEAWADASGKDIDQLLARLMDGDEPTERYFGGARPSEIEHQAGGLSR